MKIECVSINDGVVTFNIDGKEVLSPSIFVDEEANIEFNVTGKGDYHFNIGDDDQPPYMVLVEDIHYEKKGVFFEIDNTYRIYPETIHFFDIRPLN